MNTMKSLKLIFTCFFLSLLFSQTTLAQCDFPTGIAVSNESSTSATISWNESASAPGVAYRFEIRTSGLPGSGNTGLVQSGSTLDGILTTEISQLQISTSYFLYVRFQCSETPVFSPWSPAIEFETTSILAPVSNQGINISDTFFTAVWFPSQGASGYRIDVSETTDFSNFLPGFENKFVIGTAVFVNELSPNTNYYFRVRAEGTGGAGFETSPNSNVVEVTTLAEASSFIVWTENGWMPNIEPSVDYDVIINYDYNTGGQEGIDFPFYECKSLTVNEGFQFTLASGTSLIVLNEIINNAGSEGIVVENNASLVQIEEEAPENFGKITVKRNSSEIFRLDYTMWSSPLSDELTNSPQTLKQFSPGTMNNRFYSYNTTNDIFASIANPNAVYFEPGKGYLIRVDNNHVPYVDENSVPASWEGIFIGTPNNGEISVSLSNTGEGYNLIGNPYPSVISAESFIENNVSNIDGTIYFWRRRNNTSGEGDTGSFYASYTRFGGTEPSVSQGSATSEAPNGFIQVGQGFVVKALPSAAEVVFNNSLRQFEEFDNQFFRSSSAVLGTEKHRIWLNLTNASGVFSQMLVGYTEGATNGVDLGLDGKFINDSNVALTSTINNEEFIIQAKSLPFNTDDIIPLGFKISVSGEYTISLANFDGIFVDNQNIYLEDTFTNTIHNLKEGIYTFTAENGVHNSRFILRFSNQGLGLETTLNPNAVSVLTNDNSISINSGKIVMNSIIIFDVQGRKIIEHNQVNSSEFVINGLSKSNRVVIIQIKDENNNSISKKLVF